MVFLIDCEVWTVIHRLFSWHTPYFISNFFGFSTVWSCYTGYKVSVKWTSETHSKQSLWILAFKTSVKWVSSGPSSRRFCTSKWASWCCSWCRICRPGAGTVCSGRGFIRHSAPRPSGTSRSFCVSSSCSCWIPYARCVSIPTQSWTTRTNIWITKCKPTCACSVPNATSTSVALRCSWVLSSNVS